MGVVTSLGLAAAETGMTKSVVRIARAIFFIGSFSEVAKAKSVSLRF
jgi:hypothetical protein